MVAVAAVAVTVASVIVVVHCLVFDVAVEVVVVVFAGNLHLQHHYQACITISYA